MSIVVLSRLFLYPIKSLDGISVEAATFLENGPLKHDREFSLYDEKGNCVNGKRDVRLNSIRAQYDLGAFTVSLSSPTRPAWQTFQFLENQRELDDWFSTALDNSVHLKRDERFGFPDDTYSRGPTIISTGTIAELSSWFGISDYDETRRRFRTNLEVDATIPFWEDQLFGPRGQDVAFTLGDAEIFGVGPCKRCIVPTRDSMNGNVTEGFQNIFTEKRVSTFPAWANKARFGPLFFRVAVNTRVNSSETEKCVRVGDAFHRNAEESR